MQQAVTTQLAMASSNARLASDYRSLAMASGIARLASDGGMFAWRVALLAWREMTGCSPWRVALLAWRAMTEQVTGFRTFSPKTPIFTMFNPKFDQNVCINVNL